jgi:hypothetical protein
MRSSEAELRDRWGFALDELVARDVGCPTLYGRRPRKKQMLDLEFLATDPGGLVRV